MNLNKVNLIGRVTAKPELKTFTSGASVTSFSMATNREYKTKDGNKVEETEFHNIVAFGKVAEVIAKYVVRGQELYVSGRLKTDTWEKDGIKHYKTNIIIEDFQFGSKPKGNIETENEKSYNRHNAITDDKGEAVDYDDYKDDGDINPEDIPF